MMKFLLILEDHVIDAQILEDDTAKVTVTDLVSGESESYEPNSRAFCKALAIAMHPDGTPNADEDYPDAEAAQPANKTLRFIP